MNIFESLLSISSFLSWPFEVMYTALKFSLVSPEIALWALVGGLVPALLWLWFWLQEDRIHPEPKRIILRSFLAGMLTVIIVAPFERGVNCLFSVAGSNCQVLKDGVLPFVILSLALVEELGKYFAAAWSCLRTKDNDEPIDAVIYMISAALGFAALENAFFLNTPLLQNNVITSLVTGNLRFIGANLLHVISSATIGIFIAFAFYEKKWKKKIYLIIGITLAVFLHALFNFSIISTDSKNTLIIFGSVWLGIIILILVLEKVKAIKETLNT